ncbi:MAG: binding protein [Evtepia sp.]|jgi:S1 RNA binding domain protein|nr:binding protein [Evtepia sp.]
MEIIVGSVLEGNVKSITKFGAFIVLPGGRSGLVHISEISHSYVNDVKDHLQEGQEVKVKVVGIDDAGRINLSIKKAVDPPPQSQPFRNAPRPNQYARKPDYEPRTPNQQTSPRFVPPANKNPGSQDFEQMMKQFMQSSDTKLSTLRSEKRSSRRSGHK